MNSTKIYSQLIIAILSLSGLLVLLYLTGAFNIQTNVFKDAAQLSFIDVTQGDSKVLRSEYDASEGYSLCQFPVNGGNDICGITVDISGESGLGTDLSFYTSLKLDIEYSAPVLKPKLRVSFRNYNELYSNREDVVTTKYNSIVLDPSTSLKDKEITLDYVQVESWWVKNYKIPFEYSQVDMTNIIAIDFMHHNTDKPGLYSLTIKDLVLFGSLISLTELLLIVLGLWFVVFILLILRHRISLQAQANTDILTGLANRRGMALWVQKLGASEANPIELVAFYMDIDDFKHTNDNYGHLAGDRLLQEFSQRVSSVAEQGCKQKHLLTRLSGDEFILLVLDKPSFSVNDFAGNIIAKMKEPAYIESHTVFIKMSVGIAKKTLTNDSLIALFEDADSAMYFAKQRGKNQFKLYDAEVAEKAHYHQKISSYIRQALDCDGFELKFMPIFDTKKQRVGKVEVLLRGSTSELRDISPSVFIPIATEAKLIQAIDAWVLEKTLSIIHKNKLVLEGLNLRFCINVSTIDLHRSVYEKYVKSLLKKYCVPPEWIELEITETAFSKELSSTINSLSSLKDIGIRLTLDDFGTGYTALNHLVQYPVHSIKIDKCFTDLLFDDDGRSQSMVTAMIGIAKEYGLKVTAEGVETLEQFYLLQNLGCDYIQGYLYSPPLELHELVKALRNQDKLGL